MSTLRPGSVGRRLLQSLSTGERYLADPMPSGWLLYGPIDASDPINMDIDGCGSIVEDLPEGMDTIGTFDFPIPDGAAIVEA